MSRKVGQMKPKLLIRQSLGKAFVGFLGWWTSGTLDK